jgi:hypothetical protein
MPTIDVAAQLKAKMRERMPHPSTRGFSYLDAAPAVSMMVVDGKTVMMRPPLDCDRAQSEWRSDVCVRLSGPLAGFRLAGPAAHRRRERPAAGAALATGPAA